jgi:small-conductance mechanosensitive channel
MNELIESLSTWLDGDRLWSAVRAIVVLVLAVPLGRLAGLASERAFGRVLAPAQARLLRRTVGYGAFGLAVVMALRELGFDLTALLGAAGVLTVAVGFAAKTVASNLISGLFLIGERGFEVGRVVKVGDVTGEVLSIDLLSAKLRTFDNVFVRIPNESVVASQYTTLSEFPIRRVDLPLGAHYGDDLDAVEEVLLRVADDEPLCLEEPKPVLMVRGFGDNAVTLQLSVWVQRDNYVTVRTTLLKEIKRAFGSAGLRIPYPQRDVHLFEMDTAAPARPRDAA